MLLFLITVIMTKHKPYKQIANNEDCDEAEYTIAERCEHVRHNNFLADAQHKCNNTDIAFSILSFDEMLIFHK